MKILHLLGPVMIIALGVPLSDVAALPDGMTASHEAVTQDEGISPKTAADTYAKAYKLMRNSGALEAITEAQWAEMEGLYKSRAEAAKTNAELRAVLGEMIASLGKSHFALIPREASAEYLLEEEVQEVQETAGGSGDVELSTGPGDGRLGLHARLVGDRVLITRVDEDSPGGRAGIRPGWRLDAVRTLELSRILDRFQGEDVASMGGYQANATINSLLTGEPGTLVQLELTDLQDRTVTLEVEAEAFTGNVVQFGNLGSMEVETQVELLDDADLAELGVESDRPLRIGLIRFNVWMVPIMQPISEAIERFRDEQVDAVVIDLRGNPGGIGGLAMGVGGHFLTEPTNLGTMKNRYGELNFNTNPQTVSASGNSVTPLEVPVFILVDEMSASTSEIFAAGMKEAERATVVGRRTPGMALPAIAVDLPNGDVFYYAIASFTLPSGEVIEGAGVMPAVKVELDSGAFDASSDPDLAAVVRTLNE